MRYVLEGSVRRAGQRIRITAQLIDASNGKHVWAERYDAEMQDIFELQEKALTPASIHEGDLELLDNLPMQAQWIGLPTPKRGTPRS